MVISCLSPVVYAVQGKEEAEVLPHNQHGALPRL